MFADPIRMDNSASAQAPSSSSRTSPQPWQQRVGKVSARAMRQAAPWFFMGDLPAVFEILAVASLRDLPISVSLARPQDSDCPLVGVSSGFEMLTGYSRTEVVGKNCRILNHGCKINPEARHCMRLACRFGYTFTGVVQNRRKDGEKFSNLLRLQVLRIASAKYILGVQTPVEDSETQLPDPDVVSALNSIVVGIYLTCRDTLATLQASSRVQSPLHGSLPLFFPPAAENEALNAFVSLESDLKYNQLVHKKTFLEVHDSDLEARVVTLGLRKNNSEPTLLDYKSIGAGVAADNNADLLGPDIPFVRNATVPDYQPKQSGHPSLCTPCSFFCYSLAGCNRGEDCAFCHLSHPRQNKRRGQRRRKESNGGDLQKPVNIPAPST